MSVLLVFLGGSLGAPTRYLSDRLIQSWMGTRFPSIPFPAGTLAVNIVGCLILGATTGAGGLPSWTTTLIGTGFCGGLTTFSTFAVEAGELATNRVSGSSGVRGPVIAGLYVVLSLVLGLAAAAAGRVLANQ